MPEIGEVARIVSYIQKHLVGKTLAKVQAQVDDNVYGKVGCSAQAFEKALTGKKVLDVKQQGKYFWMVMSSPPHPLMHFSMAGWFKIRSDETAYYKPRKNEDPNEWPPKYWKFLLETAEQPKTEAAFVDHRRFSRIRLIDSPAEDMRNVSPLVENGPDPVVDKDVITEEWLREKLGSKKVPVKALLLDQANISGIGNWVGDEIMYNARIHPEQYSNSLSTDQIKQLHKSLHYICSIAVDTLADSSKFPEEWLFKHRWGKGKKDSTTTLPNGSKFVYLTVGGRTSCVVPSVQKKTGPVTKDVQAESSAEDEEGVDEKPKKPKKAKKVSHVKEKDDVEEEQEKPSKKKATPKKRPMKHKEGAPTINGEDASEEEDPNPSTSKKRKRNAKSEVTKSPAPKKEKHVANGDKTESDGGRRRSARVSGKGV